MIYDSHLGRYGGKDKHILGRGEKVDGIYCFFNSFNDMTISS